jgi:phosphoribosylglycinamide formyltransferase-1
MGTKVREMGAEQAKQAKQAKQIVILASGEGSVAQALFDAVTDIGGQLHNKIVISRVITENPNAGILGRAEKSGLATSVIPFCAGAERLAWENELSDELVAIDPWLVVSAGFMKILSPDFVAKFKIVNTHPSLLPLFPGAHAVRDALAAGVSESGCTLHYVDAGVDTGAVIAQRKLAVAVNESAESLHERIKVLERELIIFGILALLERGE